MEFVAAIRPWDERKPAWCVSLRPSLKRLEFLAS
jgi:hypothetical protein